MKKVIRDILHWLQRKVAHLQKPSHRPTTLKKATGIVIGRKPSATSLYPNYGTENCDHYYLEVRIEDVGVIQVKCDNVAWNLAEEGTEITILYRRHILGFSAYLDLEKLQLKPRKLGLTL